MKKLKYLSWLIAAHLFTILVPGFILWSAALLIHSAVGNPENAGYVLMLASIICGTISLILLTEADAVYDHVSKHVLPHRWRPFMEFGLFDAPKRLSSGKISDDDLEI